MGSSRTPLTPNVATRSISHDGEVWTIHETDARHVPGAQGAFCLIFESADVVRRFWLFPANWWELDDEALWRLSHHAGQMSAQTRALGQNVTLDVHAAMDSVTRVQIRIAAVRNAIAENREHRAVLADLLRRCRAERQAMRAAVQLHATRLRAAGVTVEEASILIGNAVRASAGELDDASARTLQRDAARWCELVYSAA